MPAAGDPFYGPIDPSSPWMPYIPVGTTDPVDTTDKLTTPHPTVINNPNATWKTTFPNLSDLLEKYKNETFSVNKVEPIVEKTGAILSTTSVTLDWLFGSGIPEGAIIEIYGASGSGKSVIGLFLANRYADMGIPVGIINVENKVSPLHLSRISADLITLYDTPNLQTLESLDFMSRSEKFYLVDSVCGEDPYHLNRFISNMRLAKRTVVVINQVRYDINKKLTKGYASDIMKPIVDIRLRTKRAYALKEADQQYGIRVELDVRKNLFARNRSSFIDLIKGHVDKETELLNFGIECGVLDDNNGHISILGVGIAYGRKAAIELLKKDKIVRDRIENHIRAIYNTNTEERVIRNIDDDEELKPNGSSTETKEVPPGISIVTGDPDGI